MRFRVCAFRQATLYITLPILRSEGESELGIRVKTYFIYSRIVPICAPPAPDLEALKQAPS